MQREIRRDLAVGDALAGAGHIIRRHTATHDAGDVEDAAEGEVGWLGVERSLIKEKRHARLFVYSLVRNAMRRLLYD
jgi:hypothetical protein